MSKDPRRLELDATPELQQVIDALRSDGPSTDGMQRMAQKLEPHLDAPSTASDASQGLLAGPLGKIGLIVLACGALLLFLPRVFRNSSADEQLLATDAARAVISGPRTPAVVVQAAAPIEAARQPVSQAPQAIPTVRIGVQAVPARVATPKRAMRTRVASPLTPAAPEVERSGGAATEGGPTETRTAAIEPKGSGASATTQAAFVDSSTPPPPASPQPSEATTARVSATPAARNVAPATHAGAATPANAALPLDEATLLQRARRLALERPKEALRLLDEHKRRFAQGMLAPEREVLAIEILHAQSRDAEARRRVEAFRARYPHSVYLERLNHLQ